MSPQQWENGNPNNDPRFNYPLKTWQPQFNQSRSPIQNIMDNNNNLKGSITPFMDFNYIIMLTLKKKS